MEESRKLIKTIIEGIQEKKGKQIVTVDLSDIEASSTQYFIICQGGSPAQVAAIADSVRETTLKKIGVKPYNYDGYKNAQWIIIDYGYIFVHVFQPEPRQYYNLETLWNDAKLTALPDVE
ncbi:MAG: ribosome silencing factor [Porphyromonadaceae bacterium]|nr:ribosome silencing factor [Porphyromonadaceae bacterium]